MTRLDRLKALEDAQKIAMEMICDPVVGYMWCRIYYRIEEQLYALDPRSQFPFTTVKRTLNEQVFGLEPQEISKEEFIEEIQAGRF